MASSLDAKAAFVRKVAESATEAGDPQGLFASRCVKDPEEIKRAAWMTNRMSLYKWLCSFSVPSPIKHTYSQLPLLHPPRPALSLSPVLSRGVLLATLAACMVAAGLFLSLAGRDQLSEYDLQRGRGGRSGYDARLRALGAWGEGSGFSTENGAEIDKIGNAVAEGSGAHWPFSRLSGLWEPAQDGDRQLRENLQIGAGQNKRVAILFFGLPRSVKYTLPSIEKQLLRPLRDTGYIPTVFLHTFVGSGLPGAEPEQWKLLEPFDHSVSGQKEFLERRKGDIDACLAKGTGWLNWPILNQTRNTQNMLCQLKSVEEVGKLWSNHYAVSKEEYAAVAYVRPDVLYESPFPTQLIPKLEETEVYVPGWGENKGINDRFALLHPAVALQWTGRLKHALKTCRHEPIHSETFASLFAESEALTVKKLPCDFTFFRVRATGEIAPQDDKLPGFPRANRELAKQRLRVQGNLPGPNNKSKPASPSSSNRGGKASGGSGKKLTPPEPRPQRAVHPNAPEWNNSLAVCALMKDEQLPDILEWVGYHRWLGVDKIFLRENGSKVSKNIADALKDMVAEGWLDLDSWEGQSPQAQQEWYNRCAQQDLGGALSWILFSDLDEFLVLMDKGQAVEKPNLKEYLESRRGAAGLTLQWVMFGSSGIRDRPEPGGPLSHFSKCSNKLSFEMKCLAASHHLCDVPFIKPIFLHACAYNYDREEIPTLWPPVLYGDGTRANDSKIVPMYPPPVSGPDSRTGIQRGAKCRSYSGHLQGDAYNEKTKAIPQGPTLVLFHYMTRSFQDFSERKLSRYAGMYVDDFRERREKAATRWGSTPSDAQLLDELEDSLGINMAAPVCESAIKAQYAPQCCS